MLRGVGAETHHFAFGAGRLWVSDNVAGTLVRTDYAARRVVGRTHVGPARHHVAVAGRQVRVAVHSSGQVVSVARTGSVRVDRGSDRIVAVPFRPGRQIVRVRKPVVLELMAERRDDMHEHCRLCSETCQELLAAIGWPPPSGVRRPPLGAAAPVVVLGALAGIY